MNRLLFLPFFIWPQLLFSQDSLDRQLKSAPRERITNTASKQFFVNREWLVGTSSAIALGGSFIFLNEAWYKGYDRSSFHFFNDSREWLQIDKSGHAWTAYTSSRTLYSLWRRAGAKEKKAVWLGTLSSFAYMASIEYLDGRSAAWGWSWGDIAGNTFGASLFTAQQLLWKRQKIQLKFSAHFNRYDAALQPRANYLFGTSLPGRLLKDYNAQTYWLSLNVKSFLPKSKLPPWLNVAAGYGAAGMLGASQNVGYHADGAVIFDRQNVKRYRQFYLSPDIDFTKINTKHKWLKTTFYLLNILKMPLPTLEYSTGKWKGRLVYF